MDLRSILTLKTILATGSFQKAAHHLNYTQSTITFQIRQLENELSLTLFEKIGRRMVLTQAGRDIMPYIDSILQSMQQLADYGKGHRELKGDLRIAVAESLLVFRIQPILRAFIEQAPNVKVSLCSPNCHEIRNKITTGEVDIGVYYDVGGHTQSLTVEKLRSFDIVFVAAPDLAAGHRDFVAAGQRKDVNFIINEPRSIYREMVETYFRERNIVLRNTIELWSIEAIKRSVASNLGVSCLPRFTVADELEKGMLQEVETGISGSEITAITVHHKNKWLSPAMELFMRLLRGSEAFQSPQQ